MKAKVVCMASAKGGSGKTVLTATFAAFLVNLGKRVLMVDADAATNGLTLMFLKETRMQAEIAYSERRLPRGIFEESVTKEREILRTPSGADLLPATYSFTNTDLVSSEKFEATLDSIFPPLLEKYDFIFLDVQSGSDPIAHVGMSAYFSDEVVIVSEYDPLSAAGVERLKGLFRDDLTYVRTWILLNKMLPDFVRTFSDFMEVAKYASPVPWDADVVRAYARRKLALDLELGNDFTLAIVRTMRSLFGDDIDPEIETWLSSRTAALREPIEVQLRDAEMEVEFLLRKSSSLRGDRSRLHLTALGVLVCFIGALGIGARSIWRIFYWRTEFFTSWEFPLDSLVIIGLIFTANFFINRVVRPPSAEELRIDHELASLRIRIEKLETLRSADVTTLLKHRNLVDVN